MHSLTDLPIQVGETFKNIDRFLTKKPNHHLVIKSSPTVFVAVVGNPSVSELLLAFVLGVHQAGRDGGGDFGAASLFLVA